MFQFLKSARHALSGVKTAWDTEANFRIEIVIAVLVVGTAYVLNISTTELVLCLGAIGLVVVTELMNTAIEKLSDIVHAEHHVDIKAVKDVSAGAVLCASLIATSIGFLVFTPHLLSFHP